MSKSIIMIALILAAGSAGGQSAEVKVAGNLRSIMMEGNTEAAIDLRTLAGTEHLFALGAAAHLRGEIIVMDGYPVLTKAEPDTFSLVHSWETGAALLVYAVVEDWASMQLQEEMTPGRLEAWLEGKTLGADGPVPFILEGLALDLSWHIVDGQGPAGSSHAGHPASGYPGEMRVAEVKLLGFYSTRHEGVFTHRGQFTHMHFITTDGRAAGHVDRFVLAPGSRLSLPKSM